jgi:hypothetical protein
MSKLTIAAFSLVLLALASVIIWQQQQLKKLTADAAGLRKQAAQEWSLKEGKERAAMALSEEEQGLPKRHPTAEDPLPDDKFRELLRLRGQVGVLRRQLEEANKQALGLRPASTDGILEWPEQKVRWQQAIASLVAPATAQQENLNALKRKVEQLTLTLQVPDELAAVDPGKSLDTPSLERYRPYFEAKQQRDELQRFITIRRMKAAAEEIDFEAETAKNAQK